MSALVGALRAMLTLDSTAFVSGADKATRKSKSLQTSLAPLRKTMLGVAAALGAMAGGMAVAIKGQLNLADEMGKAAQKFGVPVEELSRLKYAADLSDVSLETLGMSLGKLSKAMVAAKGGNQAQIALFQEMGVAVTDANGQLRATEVVLQDVAAKFAAMADGPEKTALALKLFGKAGAEMIPLLNAGKTGLQDMAAEANRLGIVIDAKTAKSAENFNDNLTRLKAAMGGVVTQITAALAPSLERLSQFAVDLANKFGTLSPETKELVVQIASIAGAVALAAAAFGTLMLVISPVNIAIAAVAAGAALIYANWDGIAEWFTTQWTTIKTATVDTWEAIKTSIGGAIDYVQAKWDNFILAITTAVEKVKAAGQAIADALSLSADTQAAMSSGFSSQGAASDTAAGAFNTSNMGGSNSSTNAGRSTADGLVEGYKARLAERLGEISASTGTITDTVRAKLGIQSPSTVMREVGQHTTEGLALGIKDNAPMVKGAMTEIGDAIEGDGNSLQSRLESFKSTMEGAFVGLVTGATSFKEAIGNLAKSLADMLAKKAFQGLFDALTGGKSGGGGGGVIASLLGFANGGAFSGGRVQAFATGGVVNGATAFGMQGGLGVMGEKGPEAIMPLTRGANGKLGVQASGGGGGVVTVRVMEGDMFASKVETIADRRSVQVVRQYDRNVAPQTRSRSSRERG